MQLYLYFNYANCGTRRGRAVRSWGEDESHKHTCICLQVSICVSVCVDMNYSYSHMQTNNSRGMNRKQNKCTNTCICIHKYVHECVCTCTHTLNKILILSYFKECDAFKTQQIGQVLYCLLSVCVCVRTCTHIDTQIYTYIYIFINTHPHILQYNVSREEKKTRNYKFNVMERCKYTYDNTYVHILYV